MSLRVLLADDSMTAQNMGKKILSDAGFDVTAVSNGAAALKKIAELHPDVVILDIYMPGYSGLEVCERIRVNDPKLPVLLTVGKLEPYRAEDGSHVQANGVIVKPFEASDLIDTVNRLGERALKAAAAAAPVAPPPAPAPVAQASPAVREEHAASPAAVIEQLQPGDMEFLQEAAPAKAPEPPHGAAVDYFAHEPVPAAVPEATPFEVELQPEPALMVQEIELPPVTDDDFAMLKIEESSQPAESAQPETFAVENAPLPQIAEQAEPAHELPAFEISPATQEYPALDLPVFDLNDSSVEVPHFEPMAEGETPVFEQTEPAPVSEPAPLIEDFDLSAPPEVQAEPETVPEPEIFNHALSELPENAEPELLDVQETPAHEALEVPPPAIEPLESFEVIPASEPDPLTAPTPEPEAAASFDDVPELLGEEFEPEPSSAFASQDPLLVAPDDFTSGIASVAPVLEEPAFSAPAAAALEPLEPLTLDQNEPELLSEPELLEVSEPLAPVAPVSAEKPIATAAPLDYGHVAGVIQRVFDRYKPQIIAEIVRELTEREEK